LVWVLGIVLAVNSRCTGIDIPSLLNQQMKKGLGLVSFSIANIRKGIYNKDQLSLTNLHDALHHGECGANKVDTRSV